MKNFISQTSLLLIAVSLFSCSSTHRFVTFSSDDPLDDNHEFVFVNDTLDIRYRFSGNLIPMNIYIYNKTEKPLFIDWKKSAMILNSESITYWADNMAGYSDRINYIAPLSYIEGTRMMLGDYIPEELPADKKVKKRMKYDNGEVKVDKYDFAMEESPLWFRSRLTFSTSESFENESSIESIFWVSEIIQSPRNDLYIFDSRNNYMIYQKTSFKPGNMALLSKKSNSGNTFLGIISLTALVGLNYWINDYEE